MAVNRILNGFEGISSPSIVMIWSLGRSTLGRPFLSNPSMVAQMGVYFACHYICMQMKLFLQCNRRTSISDDASPNPSPCHLSGHTKCSMTC